MIDTQEKCGVETPLRRRVLRHRRALLVLLAGALLPATISNPSEAHGLELTEWCEEYAPGLEIELRSRSGTPLLLELTGSDPETVVERVTIESDHSSARFEVGDSERFELTLAPFREVGVHDLELTVETERGSCRRELVLGFSEFKWGRDNFRFTNARSPHGSVRPYSSVLFPWAQERFGALQPEDEVILLEFAYRLFGGRIGRCYAFSGSKLRYISNPDLLPSYYDSVYAVREPVSSVQNEMNHLQNDIMFDQFVTRGYDLEASQSVEELEREVKRILDEIADGRPAAFGYVAPERHHSLLAYGFIADPKSQQVTLIAANNWGDEHNENIFSEAAERISIRLGEEYDEQRVRWVDTPLRVYEHAEHLFFVEVLPEYEHDAATLNEFIDRRRERLRSEERTLVIVEQARDAVLEGSDGKKTGRASRRTHRDLDTVEYTRIEDTHLFEFPAADELLLRVTPLDDNRDREEISGTNVYVLSHPSSDVPDRAHSAIFTNLDKHGIMELKLALSAEAVRVVSKEKEED